MRRRGFTMVELATCLSISALLVPLCFLFLRTLSARHERALWQLETAAAVRTLSEQRELDRGQTACAAAYELVADTVVRSASAECGGSLVLARGVSRFEQGADGVTVTFFLRTLAERTETLDVFLPGGAP